MTGPVLYCRQQQIEPFLICFCKRSYSTDSIPWYTNCCQWVYHNIFALLHSLSSSSSVSSPPLTLLPSSCLQVTDGFDFHEVLIKLKAEGNRQLQAYLQAHNEHAHAYSHLPFFSSPSVRFILYHTNLQLQDSQERSANIAPATQVAKFHEVIIVIVKLLVNCASLVTTNILSLLTATLRYAFFRWGCW